MGTADVIPGVSGGTIALIVGIYKRLLSAIESANKELFLRLLKLDIKGSLGVLHWKFLLVVMGGVQVAVYFFSRFVSLPTLIHVYPEPIYALFFGLIVGSAIVLVRQQLPVDGSLLTGLSIGTALGLFVVNIVPTDTPTELPFIFLYGAISIIAMILPGVSGSFILLILNKYDYILGNIARVGTSETIDALIIIGVFALGSASGLMLFSRFLNWLLNTYHRITLSVLIGFLIGSLWVIWPYQQRDYHESLQKETTLSIHDPRVKELMARPENQRKPEFERIVKQENATREVIIQQVKRKLIHSTPQLPKRLDLPYDLMTGIMALAGFSAVFFLEKLATNKEHPES